MKYASTNKIWLDNIRAIATIAVIVVHVVAPALSTEFNPSNTNNEVWWVAAIYGSFVRFCVPAFLMITGALLLTQNIGLSDFLKKRLFKILLPFVFWSTVYIVFNLGLKYRDEGNAAFNDMGKWLYFQITRGPSVHLWYVYMIIGIYLFIPIIKPWIQKASNKAILYFLSIWLVTILVAQQKFILIDTPLQLDYFSGYIGYVILGYFISERINVSLSTKIIAIGLFVLSCTITLIGTFLVSNSWGFFSQQFFEYLTINVALSAVSIFIAFKKPGRLWQNKYVIKFRDTINRHGFGIYLGHALVLNLMWHFNIDYSFITPILAIPLCTILCLILSCLLIVVIKKIPYGKYISG